MYDTAQKFYRELDRCYAEGGIAKAEEFLLACKNAPEDDRTCIAACNELGSLYRGTSRFPQSLAAFAQARDLAARVYGAHTSQYATVLCNMAGTCRLAEDFEQAVALFRRAIAIYAEAGESDGYLYANVWNNLSLAYRDMNRLEDAIRCVEQALTVLETLPQYRQELAISLNNLAVLHHAAGDNTRAAACMSRSMEAFDSCAEEENVHYAAGLNSLASFLYSTGEYEQALTAFQKSAQYTLHFFGENLEYAITWQNMSRVYEVMGRKKDAIDALCKVKSLYNSLLGPDHPRTAAAAEEIARLEEECPL